MEYNQRLKHLVPSDYEDLQCTTQLCLQQIHGKPINGVLFRLRIAAYLLNPAHGRNVALTTTLRFLPILGYLLHILFGLSYWILYDLYPDIAIALNVIPKHHWLNRFWKSIRHILRKAKGIVVLTSSMKQQVAASCLEVTDKTSFIYTSAVCELIMSIVKQTNWFFIQYKFVNKHTVLYSGDIACCHATHTILNASNYLQKEPIQFMCLGRSKREELIEEINQLGLQKFLFLPYQLNCQERYLQSYFTREVISRQYFDVLLQPIM
ncbi:glycosyltransferase family 4 protein [Tolypothrix campylonemoides VB511288]|nr:glycosyltransferase family 4 protein [Tolypothrix campylonemoides VB511288]